MLDGALASFFTALADDLEQLVRLHQCELDLATVDALQAEQFPQGLALLPTAHPRVAGLRRVDEAN